MAAEKLLQEIEDKKKKVLDALEAEYSHKIEEVRRNAEFEKNRIQQIARKLTQELSQSEKTKIIGAAKLQAKRIIFEATQKLLRDNLDLLRQTLEEWSRSKDYEDLLPRMVKYASNRLGEDIRVICRQEDLRILERTGVEIVASNLNSLGGIKAEKKDGTLELDLIFEEILPSRDEEVRRIILRES